VASARSGNSSAPSTVHGVNDHATASDGQPQRDRGPAVIAVRGAREHNLQGIDVDIPRDALTVICGVSGSGKSSLAFDTLFAEGQRRYVESLSAYARQFLGQLHKPDVDRIDGLSPSVAIDQKTRSNNPRSTVGTVTEIWDYLRVLYARAGVAHCVTCGGTLGHHDPTRLLDTVNRRWREGDDVLVLAPVVRGRKGTHRELLQQLQGAGYVRVRVDGTVHRLPYDTEALDGRRRHDIEVVVDRIRVSGTTRTRMISAVETAWEVGDGLAWVEPLETVEPGNGRLVVARGFACQDCGAGYAPLEPRHFSFNSPYGACASCDGLGTQFDGDVARIVVDPTRSLSGGAITCWAGMSAHWQRYALAQMAAAEGIDPTLPWDELDRCQRDLILHGSNQIYPSRWKGRSLQVRYEGVLPWLRTRHATATNERQRERAASYMHLVTCRSCDGGRLAPLGASVTFAGRTIGQLSGLEISELARWVDALELDERTRTVAQAALREITHRLGFLVDVGLGYLTLGRSAGSLSGGESQRIRLASQVGAALSGVLYVLDEPSIGLHPEDNRRLLNTLVSLRDLGNTVVVVEHDTETIEAADHLIEIGPGAGPAGGQLVYAGPPEGISNTASSPTGAYLSGRARIETPTQRRAGRGWLSLGDVRCHNLRGVDVELPIGALSVVCGPSGSGKSSLVVDTLWPALAQRLGSPTGTVHTTQGKVGSVSGAEELRRVVVIDQAPIGRTPRSNPATYVGVFDKIRALFASLPAAQTLGYGPGRFSFNVAGGRCEACSGDGTITVEMHFLPDVHVACEACTGRRYNDATLAVTWKGYSIADVLALPIAEARTLFSAHTGIERQLGMLCEVGLGYLPVGHPATLLSGGEAQRVKLASELQRRARTDTLYILDEPTTGLHPADVARLVEVLHRLVDAGATVVVVEHDLDVARQADWVLDLGPGGGPAGGRIVAAGTPETVAASSSPTAAFLARSLERHRHVPDT